MADRDDTDVATPARGTPMRAGTEALSADLEALTRLDAAALRAEWRRLYRVHPPGKLSRDLLELGVAWKLQERVLGGLSTTTRRQVAETARTLATKPDLAKARTVSLRPGARLVRAWGGETHEVEVVADGFLWRDRTWNSLSVIAREMTGTRWSGPRFFGLDKPKPGATGSDGARGGPADE